MIFQEASPFVQKFVEEISNQLRKLNKNSTLTRIQKAWISFCIMGIFVTGTLCWSLFNKFGLGKYKISALSWMLRHSKIMWESLLISAVKVILWKYNIKKGHLAIDDTDRQRSKSTVSIDRVHKIFDKKTGGYFMGQNIVFLLLITEEVTIPIGFKFYIPDPKKVAWNKNDEELRKQHVPKSKRPAQPPNDPAFPTKIELSLQLLSEFKEQFTNVTIHSISADALYGSKEFFKKSKNLFPYSQVMSQLRSNQKVWFRNKLMLISEVFSDTPHLNTALAIRGGETQNITIASAKVRVESHDNKSYFVVALKYDGEEEFRYIAASDSTWRALDIVKAYSLRWLIEVFFSDWKRYEGWGQMALQQGVEGSFRGVVLSLLSDLCLLYHPDQVNRIENKESACTVGTRKEQLRNEALLTCFQNILTAPSPFEEFEKLKSVFSDLFKVLESVKHLVNKKIDDLSKSTLLIKRKNALALVYL